MAKGILLDTHVWVWLVNGDISLSKTAVNAIRTAARENQLFVPVISVWEVAMLEQAGRLTFDQPCAQWVDSALSAPGLQLAPLTPAIAMDSCQLPGEFHKDPADRMIVATARSLELTLLTQDQRILTYAKSGYVKAMKA